MAIMKIRGSQIKDLSISNTQIATDAAIATTKLADGAEFVQRDGSVALTGDLSAGSNKITNLAAPTNANDAARKIDVDQATLGLNVKEAVRAATASNIDLSTGLVDTTVIDGVTLATGDRVLVKSQTDASENGIYIVAASGAASRSSDADTSDEIPLNTFCFVSEGTQYADTGWVSTNDGSFTLDTSDLTWTQFSGSGSGDVGSASNVGSAGTGVFKQLNGSDLEFYKLNSVNSLLTIALDGTDKVDFTINESSIDHNNLTNYSADEHRTINDVGTGATDLWSASKISTELGDKLDNSGYTAQYILVASAGGDMTAVAMSGDATIASDGSVTVSSDFAKVADFVVREVPTGLIDGSNTSYTLANTPVAGSEEIYLNGLLQNVGAGNDYTISSGTITFNSAPETGDIILVSYQK